MLISASLMCADALRLARDLDTLKAVGADYIHADVMDGHFVPNLMLPPQLLRRVAGYSPLPLDIHLMCERPEDMLHLFPLRKGDIATVHMESTPHVHRALQRILDSGATAGIALNPATPIEAARECLPHIGWVLIMAVNPGYAGQALVKGSLEKIARTKAYLAALGYAGVRVAVDGNCSYQNAPLMRDAGADMLVAGTSGLFDETLGIKAGMERLRAALGKP